MLWLLITEANRAWQQEEKGEKDGRTRDGRTRAKKKDPTRISHNSELIIFATDGGRSCYALYIHYSVAIKMHFLIFTGRVSPLHRHYMEVKQGRQPDPKNGQKLVKR